MAVLMPEGKQSFTNSAGVPLVGGKLYTYDTGTSTPRPTYQDTAGTTPNTNPIILDARGEATVFWSGSYKVILKDASDVTIWTVDNIESVSTDTTLRTDLAASSGSSLVGYLPAGAGAVVTTVQGKLRESVSVLDFGAVGNGIADDTVAIQAAMTAAAGKELSFGDGYTYLISTEIAGVSNVSIVGHSTIKAVTRIRSYLYFGARTNIRITGLIFDLGQSILPTYTSADYAAAVYAASNYNQAVYCYQSSKIYIRDCQFNNLYTAALLFYQCSDVVDVIGNRFESPLQAQDLNANHVLFQTCSAWISVQDNKFRNAYPTTGVRYGVAGVFTSGLTGTLDVCNNLFLYCGRNSDGGHQLGAYSSYGDVAQGVIRNNVFLLSNQQIIRLTTCHHMDVYGNYCSMNALAGADDQMVSIEGTTSLGVAPFGCDDIKVHHNTFQDDYATSRIGVFAGSYDWGYPLKDISISDNLFLGMKYAARLSGSYTRLRVERNNVSGVNGNTIGYDIATVTPTSVYGLQSNATMKDLSIQGNIIDSTSGASAVPINLIYTGFTGAISETTISGNRIYSGVGSTASAIVYRGVATGDLRITDNYIGGFALPLDGAVGSTLLFANNTCRSWTATLPTSTSSWTTASFVNNSYSTGARSGVARLIGGTVTVSTTEILTGDGVVVTRTQVDGSAMGHLSQPSIVTKTSFVINSTSGTESNFVTWEIKH